MASFYIAFGALVSFAMIAASVALLLVVSVRRIQKSIDVLTAQVRSAKTKHELDALRAEALHLRLSCWYPSQEKRVIALIHDINELLATHDD